MGNCSPASRLSKLNTISEPVVSLEEARALFETGGAVFIDARSPEAYRDGHIRGALNVPAEEFDEFFPRVLPELDPGALIITYCDGEACPLGKDLAFSLAAKGFSNVRVLINGWSVWLDAKLPVSIGEK